VALPESAVGRVDSAELRMHRSDGTVRVWSLSVSATALTAMLPDPAPGAGECEVFAFSAGTLAYYGVAQWDPAGSGTAAVTVTLGPVGRTRIDAHFGTGLP
jgi:hypothetical protein